MARFLQIASLLLVAGSCFSSATPILDFLDPFLTVGDQRQKEFGHGGGAGLDAHVGGGLGGAGFDANLGASKNLGGLDSHFDVGSHGFGADKRLGVDKHLGLDGFGIDKQFGVDKNLGVDKGFAVETGFVPSPHQRPHPPPYVRPVPVRQQPCDHTQQARPLPHRNNHLFQKQRRTLNKTQESIINSSAENEVKSTLLPTELYSTQELKTRAAPPPPQMATPTQDFDEEDVDVDKDGDVDEDDKDFLRQARSLLDKAILQKNASQNAQQAMNLLDKFQNKTRRNIPVLVIEHVQFIPLNASSDPNGTDPQLHGRSLETNATKTNSTQEERAVSPKFSGISNMFHNVFAG